jgi:hypothetical protein
MHHQSCDVTHSCELPGRKLLVGGRSRLPVSCSSAGVKAASRQASKSPPSQLPRRRAAAPPRRACGSCCAAASACACWPSASASLPQELQLLRRACTVACQVLRVYPTLGWAAAGQCRGRVLPEPEATLLLRMSHLEASSWCCCGCFLPLLQYIFLQCAWCKQPSTAVQQAPAKGLPALFPRPLQSACSTS